MRNVNLKNYKIYVHRVSGLTETRVARNARAKKKATCILLSPLTRYASKQFIHKSIFSSFIPLQDYMRTVDYTRTVVGNQVDKQPKKQTIKLDDQMSRPYIAPVFVVRDQVRTRSYIAFNVMLLNFQIHKIKGIG